MPDLQLIGVAIGGLLLLGSVYQVWGGIRQYRYGSAIGSATPITEHTQSGVLGIAEGTVAVSNGASLHSGYAGKPCVAYTNKKITQKSHGNADVRRANHLRERISESHDAIPFDVDTDGRSIHVDASGARVEAAEDHFEPVSSNDVWQNRGLLRGLWWLARNISTSTDRQVRREYLEARFSPGDHVQVIGEFTEDGSPNGRMTASSQAPLIIASKSKEAIVEGFRSTGKQKLFVGIVLVLISAIIFALITGVL